MAFHRFSSKMDISIIIATHNRAHLFRRTLESFEKLCTDGIEWELFVVDNASNDNGETEKLLKEYESKLPMTVLSEPTPGKNRALNKAILLAKGSLFVFTDNDIIADTMWISSYWDAFLRWPSADIFGGRIQPLFPAKTPEYLLGDDFLFRGMSFSEYLPKVSEGEPANIPMGPNMAIRATVFQQYSYLESIGPSGKQYPMGSETELIRRLINDGKKYVYVPASRVEHIIEAHQVTEQWLLQRAFRFGWGRSFYITKTKKSIGGIPFYVLRKAMSAWILYYVSFFVTKGKKISRGMRLNMLWGTIYGLRTKR